LTTTGICPACSAHVEAEIEMIAAQLRKTKNVLIPG
jgi:hypothetical protein